MTWLDAAPPAVRIPLVVGSILVLGVATVGLGALGTWAEDRIAVGVVGAVAAAWIGAWLRFTPRTSPAAQPRHVGWSHATTGGPLDLLAADPRFSLPRWTATLRELAGSAPAACPRLVSADRDGGGIRAVVAIREPGRVRHLAVRVADGGTTLLSEEAGPADADPPAAVDPGWPAARRALVARDGVFDVAGFEAHAREISAALDAGDDDARPYVTADGAQDLAYWRIVGLPPGGSAGGGDDVQWLEIEQDAVYDRIELRVGQRALSLCRPAAKTEAPWELWRLRRAA